MNSGLHPEFSNSKRDDRNNKKYNLQFVRNVPPHSCSSSSANKPCLGRTTEKTTKESAENKTPGIIITIIDNNNSSNNNNKGHAGISSHICFPHLLYETHCNKPCLSTFIWSARLVSGPRTGGFHQFTFYPANFTLNLTRPTGLTLCVGVPRLT